MSDNNSNAISTPSTEESPQTNKDKMTTVLAYVIGVPIGLVPVLFLVFFLFPDVLSTADTPSEVVRKLHASVNGMEEPTFENFHRLNGEDAEWRQFCVPDLQYSDILPTFDGGVFVGGVHVLRGHQIESLSHSIRNEANEATVRVIFDNGRARTIFLVKLGGEWKVRSISTEAR